MVEPNHLRGLYIMVDNVKENREVASEHIDDIVPLSKINLTISKGKVKGEIEVLKYMSRQDVHHFLSVIPPDKRHHHLLFLTLWRTGLRISEALAVKKGDIDFEKGVMRVVWLKKRKKAERYIPLHPELLQLMTYHTATMNKDQLLFPFTRQRAAQLCGRYRLKAGLESWIHCHSFRHSFAINFLEQSPHLGALQRMLGHEHINTTAQYLRILNSDIKLELMRIEW